MNIEELRSTCLAFPGATEDMPFDEHTLVFKVGNKMFALVGLRDYQFVNLKCDPDKALELRASHDAVRPGYHMNKKHWNSVYVHELPDSELLLDLIQHSYDLILASLPKKTRFEIESLE